ncbi:glycoside hydrolase family 28 protein [Cuneatibacter caecimuris]|uniref:Polygalacturonase n=1 Tax=Cuneatibacter caecimuris TaxID=1796618 RepID=A0A4V2F7Q6_9FIRM|nr:glycoside hydrolase family 28 protein [Cuneatibacter caecimuris]RZT00650.1 polygalacturonase [Cuneatibacter caecimuris]
MEINILFHTARNVVFEILDGEIYEAESDYRVFLDGGLVQESRRTVQSLYGLQPDTEYKLAVEKPGEEAAFAEFCTDREFVTLNVRKFGARGDGKADDTQAVQAAILSCPPESRVLVPRGIYRITSLFLKSGLRMELAEGAVLAADPDRSKYPVLPGMVRSWDEQSEFNLGTWEGNPLDMYASVITGIHVKDAVLYGQGTIDGNASYDNWWRDHKKKQGAWRPRQIFLNRCENVVVEGITVTNSPSWNIHPYFSENLKFLNLRILNPKVSPNTDGLDPESCRNVDIIGIYFSLGDDCIAIKSGKIYMGAKYKTPSENINVRQCCMRDGHGSVTIGSEMAGGVRNVMVKDCLFLHTDRGLRIKTRRGRGRDAVIDHIVFEHIRMDQVMTPFVINCFYYCDPDGHTEYVRAHEALPADERTPEIKNLAFQDIRADNCHVAAAFMDGLPEKKIERVLMENVSVNYASRPRADVPAMLDGVEPCTGMGVFARNIHELILKNVRISGQKGQDFILDQIDCLQKED